MQAGVAFKGMMMSSKSKKTRARISKNLRPPLSSEDQKMINKGLMNLGVASAAMPIDEYIEDIKAARDVGFRDNPELWAKAKSSGKLELFEKLAAGASMMKKAVMKFKAEHTEEPSPIIQPNAPGKQRPGGGIVVPGQFGD